ncbi:Endo/exonuclease/phosphatase domain-containing protein [Fusarium keratoplasticum]|uniref:Endo/exonuclease/phosphatase domain-containing protein n=1 Tax=Fusarium keratoplasticum TaxID=1328300 RepID=A0ACC0R6T0_9HYPO|nr:Endo/exonuclease/phosphatase domain-containing protein [Fusarium keratoplasticum]KAI8675394.1 Endo/exonuclease/phosphatase domain-containing protein [Fusarium keratoplasticum]KAI8681838.1 Endo/exonuclease/phosphatase domain-containing protein [Fusarium keratoplasticum]
MAFRITTWNVNGIRNPFGYQPWREKRTFQAMFDILEADIVVMQETKIQRKDLHDEMVLVPGWDVFFSLPKHKKGYSGVAIYTRNSKCAPIRAEEGVTGVLTPPKSTTKFRDLPPDQQIGGYPRPGQLDGIIDEATLDSEGRCVILEFPGFVLFGVYSPANRDESRDDFRSGFFQALDVRIRNLVAEGKQVILTGDLNVVRSEMDSTNVAEMLRKEDISLEDWLNMPVRRIFNQLIFEGNVVGERDEGREEPVLWDLCRCFHPERAGMNTCWDTKRNTRPANNGSRIDYVLCSDGIKDWFTFSNIQEGLMGSDHCPVFATFAHKVTVEGKERALLEVLNPSGMFRDGERQRDWSSKDLLPLSAKLIPEFDRRQSIRDMFTKKTGPSLSRQDSVSTDTPTRPPNSNTPAASAELDQVTGSQTSIASSRPDTIETTSSSQTRSQPSTKRPAETTSTASVRSLKKSKTTISSNDAKSKPLAPGQRTLQGFFKPKAPASQPDKLERVATSSTPSPTKKPTGSSKTRTSLQGSSPSLFATTAGRTSENSKATTDGESSDKVFDPIEAKESWSKLLGKRVAPRCEHNEPCISLTTKKPGVNCGRSFYICPRPLGPSGEKEKGSEWRCGTFIWSSDWNGS